MSADYQAIIIGGGPAGSAAACHLGAAGRRVLLLERHRFPRFHIGESMLPASNDVFRRLGLEDRIGEARFVEKRGASFVTEDGCLSSYIDFTSCADVASPLTFQVLRSQFDQILIERAAESGAEVRQGWRATGVELEPGGVAVTVTDPDGGETTVTAAAIVDASGQAGFLAKRLGLRRVDPELRNVAVYAHYEGVTTPVGERSGDIRIVSRRDLGWIWFIPLSATATSVGAVTSREKHAERGGDSAENVLDRYLESTPAAAEQTGHARRISPARFEADFSYAPSAYAGDRWLLAGDAGSFLDPVFSTGVLLALESGLESAAAIDAGLAAGNLSARAFSAYNRRQRRRFKVFRRFAHGFYDPAFRDLLFQPTDRFGVLDAIVSVLSGNWRLPLRARMRIAAFSPWSPPSAGSPSLPGPMMPRPLYHGLKPVGRIVLILLACCGFAAGALSAREPLPDPDAEGLTLSERFEALMARAEHQQTGLVTLEARFVQRKQSSMLLQPEESRGTLAYRAPDRVRWDFTSPTATTIIVGDQEMLTWYRDLGSAERRHVGDSADRILQLLGPGASLATLRRYFDITAAFPSGATEPYRLDLTPRMRRIERRLRSMTLALDRELFVPIYVRIEEGSGDITELRFQDLRINGEIPAERFELELPEDVEVRVVGPNGGGGR
ncbi:MAG: tryptophan 7-halogenase [Thermoanaerobaculia bacterium]